jgi:thioredoxin reductase (NADPH)
MFMPKPIIWTVDDDPDVLRAIERDLRRQYGNRYRIMAADSGAAALTGVEQLKLRNEPVALFLVDQRMPRMSGVEFLEKALGLYPGAKRALLTAYADTDAAIRAIDSVKIDHYLLSISIHPHVPKDAPILKHERNVRQEEHPLPQVHHAAIELEVIINHAP